MSLSDIVLPAGAAMQVLTSLCDASFDSILVTDATSAGKIVYANAAFRELTGYSLEAVRGQSPKILQGPATDARVIERLTSVLKAGDGTFEGTSRSTRLLIAVNSTVPHRQSDQLQERRHRVYHALARCPCARRRRRRVLACHPARGGIYVKA
jgi:PAS domain S-box-containing protein